eukprot:4250005-Pyramimonas_sp.AAC.1
MSPVLPCLEIGCPKLARQNSESSPIRQDLLVAPAQPRAPSEPLRAGSGSWRRDIFRPTQ